MAQAILRYGNPTFVPYTPSGAITAGDIIVEGYKCFIAHSDIAANAAGSVAIGGGVYEVVKEAASSTEADMGEAAYWDDSGNYAVPDSSGTTSLGIYVEDVLDTATTALIAHNLALT